jgi:hypothetical protein
MCLATELGLASPTFDEQAAGLPRQVVKPLLKLKEAVHQSSGAIPGPTWNLAVKLCGRSLRQHRRNCLVHNGRVIPQLCTTKCHSCGER